MKFVSILTVTSLLFSACSSEVSHEETYDSSHHATAVKALESKTPPYDLVVGCAGCIFKMADTEGCELAVEIAGSPFLVTGADADAHELGLCKGKQDAQLEGKLVNGKFEATKFALKP